MCVYVCIYVCVYVCGIQFTRPEYCGPHTSFQLADVHLQEHLVNNEYFVLYPKSQPKLIPAGIVPLL